MLICFIINVQQLLTTRVLDIRYAIDKPEKHEIPFCLQVSKEKSQNFYLSIYLE